MKSLLDKMILQFDALILSFFSNEELRQRYEEFLHEDPASAKARAIYEASDSVDAKATAVLQHVSIMIAVTGVLFSQADIGIFKYIFAVETLFYIALALFCLRIFMHQDFFEFSEGKSVTTKEAILDVTAKLTFFVSLLLIASVLIELVSK